MNAYGYGRTEMDILLKQTYSVMPIYLYAHREPQSKPWFFCAGGDGKHSVAPGDSGGPLLFKGIQYGIASSTWSIVMFGNPGS